MLKLLHQCTTSQRVFTDKVAGLCNKENSTCWGVQYWCAICRSTAALACAGAPPGVRNLPQHYQSLICCTPAKQSEGWSAPSLPAHGSHVAPPPPRHSSRKLALSTRTEKRVSFCAAHDCRNRRVVAPLRGTIGQQVVCFRFEDDRSAHRSQAQVTAGAEKWPAWCR